MKRVLFGFIIGIAAITPGVSGGVIAATYGIYEPAVYALVNLRKQFHAGVVFLMPLAVGGIIGVLLFSNVMENLMKTMYFEVLYIFLGLVSGSLPSLFREANSHGFKKSYFLTFGAVFIAATAGGYAVSALTGTALFSSFVFRNLLIGIIFSLGTVVPGISSSFILIRLGIYNTFLEAVSGYQFTSLCLIGGGFIITSVILIKAAEFVFRKYHGNAYYAVIGFLIASMVTVFPGVRSAGKFAVDMLLFILSFIISYFLMFFNDFRTGIKKI